MHIAQPEVAGEGEVHPEKNNTNICAAHQCDTRNLPHMTLRAHQRALSMNTLPLRARCALAAIALTTDCRRPFKEIFAHRDYLAERAGVSERTWYRAEADLVKAGLITINEQSRKARHARFGSAYIFLTETAAKLLGLIGAPLKASTKQQRTRDEKSPDDQPAQHSATSSTQTESEHSEGSASTGVSFESPSATVADPYTNDFYQSPSSQKTQQGKLPRDLERLLNLGFHKNLIFKLMKEARLAGKFLSDVVECSWAPLKKANKPIPYLRALLVKPVDFSHQARQRAADDQRRQHENREQNELAAIIHEAAGRTFIDPANDLLVRLNQAGDAAEVTLQGETRPRYATGNALLDLARGIRAGQLQPQLLNGKSLRNLASNSGDAEQYGQRRDTSVSSLHAQLMRDLLKGRRLATA